MSAKRLGNRRLSGDELRKVRTAGFILAVSYLRVGDLGRAVIVLEGLFHLNPNDVEVNALLAHAYLRRGQAQKALGITSRLVGVKRANPAYFFLRAKALSQLGRREEAAEAVELYLRHRRAKEARKAAVPTAAGQVTV